MVGALFCLLAFSAAGLASARFFVFAAFAFATETFMALGFLCAVELIGLVERFATGFEPALPGFTGALDRDLPVRAVAPGFSPEIAPAELTGALDRKSTRLNSSHLGIS